MKYAAILGNVVSGISIVGPFEQEADVVAFCEGLEIDSWLGVEITEPSQVNEPWLSERNLLHRLGEPA